MTVIEAAQKWVTARSALIDKADSKQSTLPEWDDLANAESALVLAVKELGG